MAYLNSVNDNETSLYTNYTANLNAVAGMNFPVRAH